MNFTAIAAPSVAIFCVAARNRNSIVKFACNFTEQRYGQHSAEGEGVGLPGCYTE
jgi:hypothetical protein